MQSRYNYISFFILFVLCTACKKNNNAPYDYMESEDYFGLTKGNYVEYEVTEINHIPQTSNTILSDTIHYFVKYYIQDTIRDEFNNLKYIFEVKKKNIEGIFILYEVGQLYIIIKTRIVNLLLKINVLLN